jgi:hypothetical protein
MTIYYATDRTPPAANLVAFTVREARDNFVRDDVFRRERVTAKEAAYLCKKWLGVRLSEALAKGLI